MLDVIVDALTQSIKEVSTGRSFETLVTAAIDNDLKTATLWQFDWELELSKAEVYKLTVPELGLQIQGLISLTRSEGFVLVNLVESHPENVGRGKKYDGVAGNLVAYAAKLAFQLGHDGYVAFDAKSELVDHYKRTLGAQQIGRSQRMYLDAEASQRLVGFYFGDKHEQPS